MMMSRNLRGALAAACTLAIAACGGSSPTASDASSPTAPRSPIADTTEPTIPSTETPPTVAPSTAPATPTPVESGPIESGPVESGPVETLALAPDDCPNGTYRIDADGIGLFDSLAPADDVTLNSAGGFIIALHDGRYTITSDEFVLELDSPLSTITMAVEGATTGRLDVGSDTLRLTEDSFAMTADVTVDGEPAPGQFIADAFHVTFGSATLPYTCNSDGTFTATYETPTGPATIVHIPT